MSIKLPLAINYLSWRYLKKCIITQLWNLVTFEFQPENYEYKYFSY